MKVTFLRAIFALFFGLVALVGLLANENGPTIAQTAVGPTLCVQQSAGQVVVTLPPCTFTPAPTPSPTPTPAPTPTPVVPFIQQQANFALSGTTTTSLSLSLVNAPNTTSGNNYLLAFIGEGSSQNSISGPSGWSAAKDAMGHVCSSLNNSGQQGEVLWIKKLAPGDGKGPYTFAMNVSDFYGGAILEVGNMSTTTPIELCGGQTSNNSAGPATASTLSATIANDLPIASYAPSTTGLTVSSSAGWASRSATNIATQYMTMDVESHANIAIGPITPTTTFGNLGGTNIVFLPSVDTLIVPFGQTAPTPTPSPTASPCCTNATEFPAGFRPYASTSFWNIPFPHPDVTPTLYPNSDTIIAHAIQTTDAQQLRANDINLSNTCTGTSCAADPGHPLYFVTAGDPTINVTCTTICGNTVATMQIPAKARPANIHGDSHIAVVQLDGTEIDTFGTQYPGGDWGTTGNTTLTAYTVAKCGNFYTGPGSTQDQSAATVGDTCLAGGMLTEAESLAGSINHALFVTVQCGTRGSWVYPAYQQFDNACGDGQPSFLNGAHLWLDLTDAQISAMTGLPGTANDVIIQKNWLHAMHDYGMYIMDSGGGASRAQQPNIFLEDSGPWTSVGTTSPWATYGNANGWQLQTGGAFGTARYWQFSGAWNPLISAGYTGGWPAHLHWVDPCYAHGTCG